MTTDDEDGWALRYAAFVCVVTAILMAALHWADRIDGKTAAGETTEQEREGGR